MGRRNRLDTSLQRVTSLILLRPPRTTSSNRISRKWTRIWSWKVPRVKNPVLIVKPCRYKNFRCAKHNMKERPFCPFQSTLLKVYQHQMCGLRHLEFAWHLMRWFVWMPLSLHYHHYTTHRQTKWRPSNPIASPNNKWSQGYSPIIKDISNVQPYPW